MTALYEIWPVLCHKLVRTWRAGICYPRLSLIGHILGYTVNVTEDGLYTVDLCLCMKNKAGSTCIHEALMNLSS